jgi:ABC-type transport system substrate-binding protein
MRSTRSRSVVAAVSVLVACAEPAQHAAALGAGATEPHHGGTLRLTRADEPGPLDPTSPDDPSMSRLIFDTLVDYEPGSTRLRGALAERWEVSLDGTTYTFHLRPGVPFHHGRPLVASDVKRSFERLLDAKNESILCSLFDGIDGYAAWRTHKRDELTGVVAIDDHTVELPMLSPGCVATPRPLSRRSTSETSGSICRGAPGQGHEALPPPNRSAANMEPTGARVLARSRACSRDPV